MRTSFKFTAVVKDRGAFNVVNPIVAKLREKGFIVDFFIEQNGGAHPQAESLKIDCKIRLKHLHPDGILQYFLDEKPQVLIRGLSSDSVLENAFEKYANRLRVRVVQVEDFWGGHLRGISKYAPDCILTIDELGANLIRNRPNWYWSKLALVGFAGVSKVIPPTACIMEMQRIRKENPGITVMVYPDGGPECDPALPILVKSILMSDVPIAFFPRLHPGYTNVDVPGSNPPKRWGQWCNDAMDILSKDKMVHRLPQFSTDEIIESAIATGATCVASSFSSTMYRVSNKGMCGLTLWTPVIKAQLKEHCGLDQTPLMMQGHPVIEDATSLDSILSRSYPRTFVKPYDPIVGADAVIAIAKT